MNIEFDYSLQRCRFTTVSQLIQKLFDIQVSSLEKLLDTFKQNIFKIQAVASLIDCPTENMNDLVSCLKVFTFSLRQTSFFLFFLYFIYFIHVPGRENPPGDCVGTQSVCGECSCSRSKNGQNSFEIKCFESLQKNVVIMVVFQKSEREEARMGFGGSSPCAQVVFFSINIRFTK